MSRKIPLILLTVLSVLWIAFIFSNSLTPADDSAKKSSFVTEKVNEVAAAVGIEEEVSHSTVRDMAHFSEFAILSVLLASICATVLWNKYLNRLIFSLICLSASVPACFVFACIDELLQKLSDGRVSDIVDVLLDTFGALCGTLIFAAVYTVAVMIARRKKRED